MRTAAPLAIAGIPLEPVDPRKMESMDDGKEQRLPRGDLDAATAIASYSPGTYNVLNKSMFIPSKFHLHVSLVFDVVAAAMVDDNNSLVASEATSQQNLYEWFVLPSLIYKLLRSGAWSRALSRGGACRRALGYGREGAEELCIRGWRDRRSYPSHWCLTGQMISKACDSIFRPNSHSAVSHSTHSSMLGVDGSLMLAQLETARSRGREAIMLKKTPAP
ncbi:hypothetical protein TRIUR3_33322 [Triticum urartu]|uniref:Uncharacterized protein n=1 Tax=Triticum urartu TaxID=4572 RepID=M7YMX8_TRIUA|nr:hypothetical protein TRIUR3_33322 [Triticum urartu]